MAARTSSALIKMAARIASSNGFKFGAFTAQSDGTIQHPLVEREHVDANQILDGIDTIVQSGHVRVDAVDVGVEERASLCCGRPSDLAVVRRRPASEFLQLLARAGLALLPDGVGAFTK